MIDPMSVNPTADAKSAPAPDAKPAQASAAPEPKSGRASPLSREERRATIIEATIPLLIEQGAAVNSKQIAQAAGVAVGTIYSVFEDKDELIKACVKQHFDAHTAVAAFEELAQLPSLEQRVDGIIRATQQRAAGIFALISLLDSEERKNTHWRPDERAVHHACVHLLEPFSQLLRVPPQRAVQVIRSSAFSLANSFLAGGEVLSVEDIRDLVMHGIAHN